MNIRCKQCGKTHNISDSAVKNKKIHFFCDECNHKVSVDCRNNLCSVTTKKTEEPALPESKPEEKILYQEKTEEIPVERPVKKPAKKNLPMLSDILSAVPLFFNKTTILMGFIFSIFSVLLIGLTALIISKNMAYFSKHLTAMSVFIIFIFSILYYSYNLFLYFISKIYYSNLNQSKKIDWGFITFDLKEDAITLLITSIGIPIMLMVVVFLFSLMGSAGFLLNIIIFPFTFVLALIAFISIISLRYIPAYLASRSLYVIDALKEIKSFLLKEILHLPVYSIIINIISLFVYSLISFVTLGAYTILLRLLSLTMDDGVKSEIWNYINSAPSAFMGGGTPMVGLSTKIGIILLGIFTLAIVLLVWSITTGITQSLYVKASNIMIDNPGKSINKTLLLIILSLLVLSAGILLFFYPCSEYLGKLNRFY